MAKEASKLQVLKSFHSVAKSVLEKAGYGWRTEEYNGIHLGLWGIKVPVKKGSKPNVNPKRFILLPGFGDTPMSWIPVLVMLGPVLMKNYDEIMLVDFPGFQGFLSDDPCAPSMDQLLLATGSMLDKYQPNTILAHSLGGWITATYCSSWGNGERKSQSNNSSYSGPETVILACPAGAFGNDLEKDRWRNHFEESIKLGKNPLEGKLFAKEPVWFRMIAREFEGFVSRKDVKDFMLSIRDDHNLENRLGYIKSKVWIIWGELDTLIPSAWVAQWLKNLVTEKKAVFIKDSGHGPHIEKPAITAIVLSQILSGIEPHGIGKRWWKMLDDVQ